MGKKVLLVDLDPQGHLSLYFGIDTEQLGRTVYNVLLDGGMTAEEALLPTMLPNVHLLPANIDLCGAEIQLVHEIGRESILRQKLAPLSSAYDYILIDCQPSLGLLVVNALSAADEVIVPLQCSFLALRGLGMLLDTVTKVSERMNPELHISGILLTMHDPRTLHSREVAQITRERFGDLVFSTMIHRSVRFDESPVRGEPITSYAGETRSADEYRSFAKEVLNGKARARKHSARAAG
jgi:chromosome partitioning protein